MWYIVYSNTYILYYILILYIIAFKYGFNSKYHPCTLYYTVKFCQERKH